MIVCLQCKAPLELQSFNTKEMVACPSCINPYRALVFPAFFEEQGSANISESLLVENESSCFFHLQKKAVAVCHVCGRFLCSLCDIEIGSEHLCANCIEAGKIRRKTEKFETHRKLYDNVALALAIIPFVVCFYLTIVTAPASLYLSIRHWKSPMSIIPRTKVRFILAIVFSSLQITGWILLFIYLLGRL